jgi:hypothetical protein
MAQKAKEVEPTATWMKVTCPVATLNPETGEHFSDKIILQVFKTRCYDKDTDRRWQCLPQKCKTALAHELKAHTATWDETMLEMKHHRG